MFFLENFSFLTNKSTSSRNPEENADRIIEIQQGSIKNLIHIPISLKNQPQNHPWQDWRYLGLMCLDFFFLRLANLLYLISFILILACDDEETTIMPSILIFFFFPFYLLKRWLLDSQRMNALWQESYRKIKKIVFRSHDYYKDCTWGDLTVGDIILLRRNEIFPADVLILDSENEDCLLQTRFVDGKSLETKKKPIKLTRVSKYSPFKGNLEEYKKMLTGKFQYDPPSKDLNSFKGTLKLKKDPISEELTIQNLCLKGSVLTYSDWMIGLVAYVGSEVKISDSPSILCLFQDDFINNFFNKLNLMTLALILISCVVCVIRVSSNDELFHQIFNDNTMEILFVNFVTMIPTNIQTLTEGLTLLYKYLLEKKFKGNLFLFSPFKLPYMSQISHVILDKGPCIDDSKTSIHSLYMTKAKNFFVTPNFLQKEHVDQINLQSKSNQKVIKIHDIPVKIVKEEPKILLPHSESLKLSVPEEGFLSNMPSKVKYKFTPRENEIEVGSESFQGQGETTKNQEIAKDDGTLMTLGASRGDRLDVLPQTNDNKSNNNPITPEFSKRLINSELSELDKMGVLNEILGNTNNIPPKFEEIFRALLLCHEARSKEQISKDEVNGNNNDTTYIHEFSVPDSRTILDFIDRYQYKFLYQCTILNNMIKCYNVTINGKNSQYYVLGSELSHPESDSNHYKYTILVKPSVTISDPIMANNNDNINEDPVLYFRTDDIAFLDILDVEETEKDFLKLKLEFMKSKGLRFSIFGQKKKVTEEEVAHYLNHIRDPTKPFDLHTNCELLAIVAIKDKTTKGLTSLVKDFLTIENKVWLLSNDNEDQVISTGYLLGLLSKDCESIRLEIPSENFNINEAWIKIRAALNKGKKILMNNEVKPSSPSLKPKKSFIEKSKILSMSYKMKYSLIINGKTLEILAKDQDLLSHFVFIAHFSTSLIGYQLSPKDKCFLVTLIREQFPNKPVVMTISEGFSDNLMNRKAHISVNMKLYDIKVKTPNNFHYASILSPISDISLNSFHLLREFMHVKSLTFLIRIFNTVLSCYSANFLYIIPVAFYILFFGVLTGQLISPYLLIIKDIIVLNLIFILYFFWGEKYRPVLLKTFISIYHDGRYYAEQCYKIAFWRVFVNGIIDSLIIMCMLVYGLDYSILGNTLLFEEFSILLYSSVFFMVFVKMTFYFKNPIIILVLQVLLGVFIFYIVALLTQNSDQVLTLNMFEVIMDISTNKEVLLMLIFLILYQLIRTYFNKYFLFQKYFKGNYGNILNLLKKGIKINVIKAIDFNLLKRGNGEFNLKNVNEVIRKIFKYKHMDILIQEMLNPNELNVNESGYHPITLKFKDRELEGQYMSQITKFSVSKKKKITTLALANYVLLDVALLLIVYEQNQPAHANIALASTAFAFSLIFNLFLLKIDNVEYHKIPTILLPACSLTLNILLVVFSMEEDFNSVVMIYTLMLSVIFQSEYIEVFIHYFLMCMGLLIIFLVKTISSNPLFVLSNLDENPSDNPLETPQKVSMIFEGLVIIGYEIYSKYRKEQIYRNIFLNERAIKQENKKIGDLLSILVPSFVKESMIQGVQSLSEDQGDVTIMFCDICNFDKIIKQEQQRVIQILDNLFRMFDTFCLENDVQKIETVGKTYMACAGLKAVESTFQTIRNKNSTQRVINLALNMMSYTKKFSWGDNEKISIKIGIHYGPVLAGVIGYHKPQFSLIGDTVNTTSRVCSTGEDCVITISKEGFDNIHGNYKSLEFNERSVEAKGKGLIMTYQIRKNRKGHKSTIMKDLPKDHKEIRFEPKQIVSREENTQDLINIANKFRKNIRKITMLQVIGKTTIMNSPVSMKDKDPSFISRSPKNFARLTSANTFKKGNNNGLDYLEKNNHANSINVQDYRSESMNFNRMCSELKGFYNEEVNSTFEKKHSLLSKSEQEHHGLNLLQYIENEHFKALNSNNNLVLDRIEKVECFPGQFNINKVDSALNLQNSGTSNLNDDDFFDKLKVKENTLEVLNYHNIWLNFKDTDPLVVQEFIEKSREMFYNENLASFSVFTLIYLINTFLLILKKNYLENFVILLVSRLIIITLNFLTFLTFKKKNSESYFKRKVLLILAGLTSTELLSEFLITDYMGMENSLEIIVFFMIYINLSYLFFLDNLLMAGYIFLLLILYMIKKPQIEFAVTIGLLMSCLSLIMNNLRVKLLNSFKNFNTLRMDIVKKNQQNNLIVNLLPTHILEKFLRNPNQKLNLTDEFEDVTILFADIAGFTKYSSTVSPTQVVAVLKDLFTEFDKLCLENCVYKLYTIGDCYVVLGVIDADDRDYEREALNVVNMGFQMIEKIKEVKKRVSFHDIDMRIGIHTGKIIGGVIGTDIVRYDVYGKDVVIANKMESNGIVGNITVSERTKDVLMRAFRDDFVFAYHKDVHLQSFNQTVRCFKIIDVRNES